MTQEDARLRAAGASARRHDALRPEREKRPAAEAVRGQKDRQCV